jgi:biopolymer transport protein TolQ
MDRFEQAFWSGQSLEELYRSLSSRPTHSMAALFIAAMREWKRSFEGQARSFAGLQTRIEKVMDVTIAREIERLERRLLVLATVGSAGPFIGLFGTVWGIMTSFQSIAASKNTSLAIVAPGIAEALFATAIGLVAAIPATIFYNKFVSEVNKQAARLEGFADEFAAILSRQIDERGGGVSMAVAGGAHAGVFGKRRHRRSPVMAEINVTPMVDVMLVLLIIFMVSAPLLTVGVPIDLPQTQAKSLDQDKEPMAVSVNEKGQVFLQNSEVKLDELVVKLKAIADARSGLDERVYVRGDRKVDYGTVMRVMGRLSAAGFRRVALVTEVEQGT